MAEPGAEAAGGLTAPPPPPPPPPQKSDTAVGDATTPPPLQTDTADPGTPASAPTPPPQNQAAAAETAGQPQLHQPPIQTEASSAASLPPQRQTATGEVSGASQLTRTPSQEKTVAAGAESHLPAPPQEQGDSAIDGNDSKDSAMENPRQAEEEKPGPSRWRRVRSPVLLLLSLFRLRLGKQDQRIKHPRISPPPGAGDVPHKLETEKDETEGIKRRRHEAEASMSASGRKEAPLMEPHQTKRRKSLQRTESVLPPEGVVGSQADSNASPLKRKLQNACRLVKNTMSWYRRHRSPENVEDPEEEAAAEKEKLAESKPSMSPPEEVEPKSKQDDKMDQSTKQPSTAAQEGQSSQKKMPQWAKDRLEAILEDACMMLVESEFGNRLNQKQQRCLLTFSVFPLGSDVKKQAVTYWWSSRFKLPLEKGAGNADEIFKTLSGKGFLEPIKNRCSGVIHGCLVNPLVHWMMKRMAREKDLADLDNCGSPAADQTKSEVLCLTPANRGKMQMLRDDDDSQARITPRPTKVPPDGTVAAGGPTEEQQKKAKLDAEKLQTAILLIEYERKKVILNISAHVYRLPKILLIKLADQLEVLQLGRWWANSDDDTYMEVEALESLSAIGKLKNLRYLSLRGLSRLTELPSELRRLRRLAILDARGCQNLISVPSATVQKLKGLTHLDLTECYMLEHIGRGVSALSELRVFKGFVFGVGKRRRDACRLQHLAKLKKLQKLNVNVTTDANVEKDEMAQLGKLAGIVSLTVTWGERPSVLLDPSQKHHLDELIKRWTGLVLPPGLEKLDVRCYPERELPVKRWLNGHRNLKKLYVRGGEVEELDIPNDNEIETLRLRYLNKFRMNWTNELLPKLNGNMKRIKCVEVVDKDLKVTRNQTKGKGDDKVKDEHKKKKVKEEEQELIPHKDISRKIKKRMKIPESTIDENGVWVKDPKEEAAGTSTPQDAPKAEAVTGAAGKAEEGDDGKEQTEVKGKQSSIKGTEGENEQAAEEDRGDTSEKKKVDGGDIVKEEKDHMKTAKDEGHDIVKKDAKVHEPTVDENRRQEMDEKEIKEDVEKPASPTLAVDQTVAPASGGDIKKGAVIDTDKISEVKEEPEDRMGGAKGQDEPPIKEDKGDVGEPRKFDGGDADEPQAEGEGEGKDEGQEGDSKVFDMVDEQPTAGQDGGGGDTNAADVTSSLAPQPSEPEEENPAKLIPHAETTTRKVTPPALPPAATSAAPVAAVQAAVDPKEHAIVGHDEVSTGTVRTE